MKKTLALTVILVFAVSVQAGITITGNVDPADPATWTSSTNSYIGKDADGTMTVNGGSDVTSRNSIIGGYLSGDSGVIGTVTVDGAGSTWVNSYLMVGNYGTGNLNITDGGLVTSDNGASLGANSTGIGIVTVDGAGSHWITDTTGGNWLYVGDYGTGTLNISNGGIVTSATSVIGNYTGSGTATVTGSGSQWTHTGELVVGFEGTGALTIADGGVVSNTDGTIGYDSDATGTVTVNNGTWTNSGYLYIGEEGTGTLNITAGGSVSNTKGFIGYGSTGDGTVTVDGAGSTWTNSSELYVGGLGTGTLDVTNGGAVSSTYGSVGSQSGSTGIATIDHGTWTMSEALWVGYDGTGTLSIENGGAVSNTYGDIGRSAGATGTATVDGAGSTWTNSSDLYVGRFGTGTLNITNGGVVTNANGTIGQAAGSDGTATVNGTDSQWTNSGSLSVGAYGNGTLDITNGGSVSDTFGYIGFFTDSTGAVTVSGTDSTWTNSNQLRIGHQGDGTLTISNGGAVSNTNDGNIGYETGSTGTVTVDNGTWTNGGTLYVGRSGTGTLNVTGGGVVSNATGYTGRETGSIGTATVDGAGSQWNNSGDLTIGAAGAGTLNITAGGAVSSVNGIVSHNPGSTGTVTVNNGTWTNTGGLYVSQSGTGTLNISNGGTVSNTAGYIGRFSGATGTVTIDGAASQWNNSAALRVGDSGTGTLDITGGGSVSNTDGYMGYSADSDGTATVAGTGSTWTNSGSLYVGREGSGTLTISNGGTVSNTLGYVGGVTGSTGTATATVTGAGSTWANSGYLYVGRDGGASLTVANGGTVTSMAGSIATEVGTTGTVTVTGTNSRWTLSDLIHVGCGMTDGQLVTRGAGTLNISDGGRVFVPYGVIGSTSTLSGDGILTLDSGSGTLGNHGTIAPGNSIGTLTVDGHVVFEDGSTLEAEIDNAGNCDKLNVTGDVTINSGSTLAVNSNGETIEAEKQYTLIEADGTITGQFTTVDTALVDWDADVQHSMAYDGSTAALVVTADAVLPFDDLSLLCTDNQRACGRAVEQIADGGGDLGGITGALQGIVGDDNLRHAYDQLSGQTRPSIAPIANAGVSRFNGAVAGRMQSARVASLGAEGPLLAMAGPTSRVFASQGSTTDVPAVGNGSHHDGDDLYGFWTKGLGVIGSRDSEAGVNGYDYETGGFALGLDVQFTENVMGGITFGYSDADVEYSDSPDNSRIESIHGGLYASYKDLDGYIDGMVTYTDLASETDRYVDFVSEKNEGDFDGYEVSAYIEIARNYYFKDILVQPLGGFEFGYQHQDSYTETGGSSALRYEDQTFESYESSLGAKASKYFYKRGKQNLWAQLRAKWLHEFGDATADVTGSFASTPGFRFSIKDSKMNRDSAVLGTGLKYEPNGATVLFADYDALFNGDLVAHVFSGGVKFTW